MAKKLSPKEIPIPAGTDIGKIEARAIVDEMQTSYLDYAMSVIVQRALPDIRDGLKPVQRRILYAMWTMGLRANAKFRKSATVVGEVLGKYHPHGDQSVYDAMVRMAQDFSERYPRIRGQGNFGSMDGDSAAAMRYTEVKLAGVAEELLFDIDKDTVEFAPNYDASHKEPVVLPAKIPGLLLNGTVGIAVGMATNIPPHNLREICDGVMLLLDNPDASISDLCKIVKGPDFPTGGIIYGTKDIAAAYATGRGSIVMRGKTEIVEDDNTAKIFITEVPFQVNKATLIERIADLVRDKELEGIKDLRDESNKDGVRIVIELKRDAYPKKVLNKLFLSTDLQTSFHVNMLALIDGLQPRVLNLKSMLEEFVKHRETVIRRRATFELARARDRAHILEGLKMALLHIDKIIETIRKSADKDEAKVNLIKKFKLTEPQTLAILEMKLSALANLERLRVETELKEKLAIVKELEALLSSAKKIRAVIKQETAEIRVKYGDDRKTDIVVHGVKEFSVEDIIPNEPTIVMITHDGYVKRVPPDTFKTQARGGKGVIGVTTKEEDVVQHLFTTNTHADMLFFTSRGRVFGMKAYDVPPGSRTSKGQALVNFLQLSAGEKVSAVLSIPDIAEQKHLVMVTKNGNIKKTAIEEFKNLRANGLIAIKLRDEDILEWVRPSTGADDVILVTAQGQSIRFAEKSVRPMGRAAAGVRGIKLKKKGDRVIGMDIVDPEMVKKNMLELFVIAENGMGKRTNLKEYKLQGRGGSGIKTMHISAKTGEAVGAYVSASSDERDLIVVSKNGQVIRLPFGSVSKLGRDTQGVRLMRFKEQSDVVATVTFI
ncbi:MAG: DNA gyrase subunit A [Patescibacteria group bacterium]